MSVFYGCWSIIIIVGFGTSVGADFPPAVDVFGAWLSKLMPTIDGIILLSMLQRVVAKTDGKVAAHNSTSRGPSKAAAV